jgi:hypothetical protein
MELEHIKNSILDIRGFASLCTFAKASDKASRKQERKSCLEQEYGQKFSDIEQVLNFLIQKDQKKAQQQQRDRIGFKK